MRDGYKNKYTDPRKLETTTSDYLMEIQQIKHNNKKLKRAKAKEKRQQQNKAETNSVDISNTCNICNKTLNTSSGLKQHNTKMHQNKNSNTNSNNTTTV